MLDFEKVKELLLESYNRYKDCDIGANADYIPYLANVDDKLAAMSILTVDGKKFSVGDYNYRFAIESISKVCTLALALKERGIEEVRLKVGDSPTGLPFNSVMALELHNGKPMSPLVNAGAMTTTSLIKAENKEERFKKILNFQRQLMSTQVDLSEEVNKSEQETNFHNRAIAWLLYSASNLYCDPMEACEVYTKQCSTLVSCEDLAILAATLANKGVNPISKSRVIDSELIQPILAEMMMEGLYDGSGDFAYLVGLPGKSGVGGGLLVVVPNVMGIACFSPPLDEFGNSVRGQKMINYFANKLNLSIFN